MIEATGLSRYYGKLQAVKDATFQIQTGELFVLLGPNGAGKTTLVRMLMGLIKPSKGTAHVKGHDVITDRENIWRIAGYVPEGMGFYEYLDAYEYLDLFGRLRGIPSNERKNRIETLIDFFRLKRAEKRKIGTFSKGMLRRLTLAQALLHDPEVLFLDEPTAGLDPEIAAFTRHFIKNLCKEQERTFFICTHNLKEAEELGHKLAIIQSGQILFLGSLEQLKSGVSPSCIIEIILAHGMSKALKVLQNLEFINILNYERNTITAEVKDPITNNPEIIEQIMGAGGKIVYLKAREISLEDAYLKLVGEAYATS